MRILPVYKGYTVDNRCKQFRKCPVDGMMEFIDFDSDEGDQILAEMIDRDLNLEPMEHDTPLGQQYLHDLNEATYGKESV
jgi:hypothetical protein